MHEGDRSRGWLLDLFHGVPRAKQICARCDDPFPGREPFDDRYAVADERARTNVDDLRYQSAVLLLQAVHQVLVADGIMNEGVDRYEDLLTFGRFARDENRRNHSGAEFLCGVVDRDDDFE